MKFYGKSPDEVAEELNVDISKGLTNEEIIERRKKYGANEFTVKEEGGFLEDLKEALSEPMILILIAAALISALIGEFTDAVGIVGAIVLGVGIGMITEGRSKKAAQALSELTENIEVKVIRNGSIHQVPKNELVVGDIVCFETGDMIPADGRLIESINLKIREDMLTGESDDVRKREDVIIPMEKIESKGKVIEQDPVPAKQINMLFGGTLVAYGRGTMIITSVGDNTEMGKIAENLAEDDLETPLQVKLGDLGGKITKISSALAGLLFIMMTANMVMKDVLNIDMSGIMPFLESIEPVKTAFTVCVALIVAAVPEGLPTLVNMTLAVTMSKMVKINALVTKKEACETIGSVSVICSDKTGTLTQNRMTVEVVYNDGKYAQDNSCSSNGYFADNCILNSTAHIEEIDGNYKYIGSATECALLLYNKDKDYRKIRSTSEIIQQKPFNSELKRMTTIIRSNGDYVLLCKGAPEVVLNRCSYIQMENAIVELTSEIKDEILNEIQKLQVKSMRALGFAYKKVEESIIEAASESLTGSTSEEIDNELIFTGFVGIRDPLREDVKESVKTANKAHVEVKMLTGDNIVTAKAIGHELGLLDNNMRAVESSFIDTLSDEELQEEIKKISIVARSKPDTKMRIVNALQNNGEVVAVTGDGINDAPALSKADVGIAMGISGTEVSKSAADIILTDDSFSTIVKGIQWGRGIYDNFQRFIQFQLTVNIIAFLIAILSQITGREMPFTTIQLLWVNIIMDGPPALVLGLEPVRNHVLKRKPVNRNASIITKTMITTIILNAFYITSVLLLQQNFNIIGASKEQETTVMFCIFAFSVLFNAFNSREFGTDSIIPNFTKNALAIKVILITGIAQILCVEVFRDFFNSVHLDLIMWIKILALGSSIILVNECVKFILRLLNKKQS
ncbi:calcium-translocating P-type ATPase, PMCA-type [uncultured Clostridium sp.]|uniref:calcium-translocating P-type ATPase, PMCA-type n=1 Tax=uncultured Clostridium sp. TaxID=59620 RepID=UPI00345BF542